MPSEYTQSFLSSFVRIKKGEWGKTLLMFLYFFFTITSYYILKPVRDSVFIDKYGAENLPYVWLLTIVVMSFVASVYVRFVDILQKNVLLSSTVVFFIINLVGFWWLSRYQFPWLPFVFFIWVSIFSVMSTTQFWLYANDLFNPREAKRLFGYVGSGGILGGIMGGVITNHLVKIVGTANLLLVAAFILLFCVLLINIIWELERGKSFAASEQEQAYQSPQQQKETSEVIQMIFQKKYLLLLVGLICVTKMVSTLVDYQFKNLVASHIIGLDAKTAFFGNFFAWLNTLSFLVQFFCTSFVLRRFGVGAALCLLPFGLAFGSLAILVHPALWAAVFTMIYDGSMNYSLNQSTKEVLYLPIKRDLRYRVKPFIDMVGYRVAKALGSILILLFVNALHYDVRSLSVVSLGLILLWVIMILIMKKEYVNALRDFLKTGFTGVQAQIVALSESKLFSGLLELKRKAFSQDTVLAARLLNLTKKTSFLNYLSAQKELPAADVKNKLSVFLEGEQFGKLEDELQDFLKVRDPEEAGLAVRFFADFERDHIAKTHAYAESQFPSLRAAGSCGLILFGDADETEKYVKNLIDADEHLAALTPEQVMERFPAGSEEKETALQQTLLKIVKWLSQNLSTQENLRKEWQETFSKNDRVAAAFNVLIESKKQLPFSYRLNLPVLLGVWGSPEAVSILYNMLSGEDCVMRDQVIQVLVQIRERFPERIFSQEKTQKEIEKEIESNYKIQKMMDYYKREAQKKGVSLNEREDPFLLAQESRFHEGVGRIFLFLSLLAEPEDTRIIYYSLTHTSEHLKASALELLENIIEQPKLKKEVLQLIDVDFSSRLRRGLSLLLKPLYGAETKPAFSLESALSGEDLWFFMSGIYIIKVYELEAYYSQLRLLASSDQPLLLKDIAAAVFP